MKYIYSLFIITILATTSVFAADKDRVAILDFKAQGVPNSTAKVVTDMIGAKVFEARIFVIVERNQVDQVFKELALQQTGCTDSACAVEVGRLLAANKIIIGTVHKADRLIVVVKVVNVADNKVEGNYRVEADNEAGLEPAILDVVENLKYDFKTGMYFSASLSLGYQRASGDFTELTDGGFGVNINFYINNLFFKSSILNISSGVYFYNGNGEEIDSILGIPAIVYIGYSFNLARNTKIIPYLGGGYYIYLMNYDSNNADVYGRYEYKREAFYDPAVSLRCDIDYALTSFIHLFLAPTYTFAFEKNHNPQTAGADAGIRVYF